MRRSSGIEEWEDVDNWWQGRPCPEKAGLFTATRSDDEPWRIERLRRIWMKSQCIVTILRGRAIPDDAITRIHDHKGDLHIVFKSYLWLEVLEPVFISAWSVGEGEEASNVRAMFEGMDGLDEIMGAFE